MIKTTYRVVDTTTQFIFSFCTTQKKERAQEWKRSYYMEPKSTMPIEMNYAFQFAIVDGEASPLNVNDRGKLRLASPPEPLVAAVYRLSELIDEGLTFALPSCVFHFR